MEQEKNETTCRSPLEQFANRLRKNNRILKKWARKNSIQCYRIYDRDIVRVPFCIERYGDYAVVYEYARRHDKTQEEHKAWLDHHLRVIGDVLETQKEKTVFKLRERQRDKLQYEKLAQKREHFIVTENQHRFMINVHDYIDCGLFLDHRTTRAMIQEISAGKKFLNLFAYTGSFSVYAAAGGAALTHTVDLSPVYAEWAEKNLHLNGFDSHKHTVFQGESFEFIRSAKNNFYDLIVVDPPTFSNSKRMRGSFDIQRDHAALLKELYPILSKDGIIYFSTNFKNFRFAGIAGDTLKKSADENLIRGFSVQEITDKTIPKDFRDANIHKVFCLKKTDL